MSHEIRQTARNQWKTILNAAGVELSLLDGKHHPCPICGEGRDRFRFDDKEGRGTYICNQCGAGDGFTFLQKFKGWEFKDAAKFVEGVLGVKPNQSLNQQPVKYHRFQSPDELLKVWGSLPLASTNHPYLQRKKIQPHMARLNGNELLIPIQCDLNGTVVSAQRILATKNKSGKDKFLIKGTVKKASFCLLGEVKDDTDVLLFAEGFATGASIYEAINKPVIVCFDAGNFYSVVEKLRGDLPDCRFLLCPDADETGKNKARQTAKRFNCQWIAPDFTRHKSDNATDFNDLAQLAGLKEVSNQLQTAIDKFIKPDICLSDIRLPDLSEKVIQALLKRNVPPYIFNKSSMLVRLNTADADGDLELRLESLDIDKLMYELQRSANYYHLSAEGDKISRDAPTKVAKDILAAPDFPEFPALQRIATAPCITANERIIKTPGYDVETGIYYFQSEPLTIPDATPTPENISKAKSLINDLMADFPFVSDADKSHAIALLILPFVRDLIEGNTPLHFFTAPTPRTGKSLLAEVICKVSNPLLSASTAPTGRDSDEEWRKAITTALLAENPHIWFDNVKGMIDSSKLEAALTSNSWSDRALGSNRQLRLTNNRAWLATGNNAELSTDLAGRSIEIRLDANMENPSERSGFTHPDIIAWGKQHRGELIAAVLTLVQNWISQDKPAPSEDVPNLGGYAQWRYVIGGILHAADIKGFLANRKDTIARVNSQDDMFKSFVEDWWKDKGRQTVKVKDLYEIAKEADLFEEVLAAPNERGEQSRLGRWLTRNKDRVYSKYKILTTRNDKDKQAYMLEVIEQDMSDNEPFD